jgi:hypothetical protein
MIGKTISHYPDRYRQDGRIRRKVVEKPRHTDGGQVSEAEKEVDYKVQVFKLGRTLAVEHSINQ